MRPWRTTQTDGLVSVIIPTFNRAAFIAEALSSIFAQTYPDIEIIVVDNGSTDETQDILASYGQAIRTIKTGNHGKTAAINAGCAAAGGEFVWIMDDDDIAPPSALSDLVHALVVGRHAGLAFGDMVKFRDLPSGRRTYEPVVYDSPERPFFPHIMEDCFITGHPCTLFRRSALDPVLPLDESVRVSVDYNMLLQVARRSTAVHAAQVVLYQRQHAGLRGPQEARYTERDRNDRWRKTDTALLGAILPDLTLPEFLGKPYWMRLGQLDRRAALLQRAVIAGRKQLWNLCFESLRAGFDIAPTKPLSRAERSTLSRLLGCRYGLDDVYSDPRILSTLKALTVGRPDRSAVLASLGRALLQRVKVAARVRSPAELIQASGAYWRLCGPSAGI
jgi:glycosyltransferase involved in cell wall biosynthesis